LKKIFGPAKLDTMNTDQTLDEAYQAISEKLQNMEGGDCLEKRTLMAIIDDRHEDANRLLEIVARRNALNLHSVEGGKEFPPQPSSKDNGHP
jgi:hypothetical protein